MAIELSPTKLRTFRECPYRYFLIYEARIKMPVSVFLVFGTAIHDLIRLLYRLNEKQRAERVAQGKTQLFYENPQALVRFWLGVYWPEVLKGEEANPKLVAHPRAIRFNGRTEEEVREEEKKFGQLGAAILSKYHQDNVWSPWPFAIEDDFRVPAPGRPDIRVVGKIDQIREVDGRFHILDFKTGWEDFGRNEARVQFPVHHDYQFTAYSWAFRMKYGFQENGIIRYPLGYKGRDPLTDERIEKKAIVSPPRTEKDYAHLAQLIDFFLLASEYELWPRFYDDSGCRFCDYQDPCQSPERFIVSQPQEVSHLDWGRVDINSLRIQLEEAARKRLLYFSQPRLKLKARR